MFFRCFSLSARIDFAHLGEKKKHITLQWDQLRIDFFVRSEVLKRKHEVDSKQEIEKEGVN